MAKIRRTQGHFFDHGTAPAAAGAPMAGPQAFVYLQGAGSNGD